jgi:hypothetical protein
VVTGANWGSQRAAAANIAQICLEILYFSFAM